MSFARKDDEFQKRGVRAAMQEISDYQQMVIEFRDAIRKTSELKRTREGGF